MSLLDPATTIRQEMRADADALEQLSAVVPGLVRLAPDGRAEVAMDRLGAALADIFPAQRAAELCQSIGEYGAGGALALDEGSVLIPWRALEETVALVGGTPERVREAIGLTGIREPESLAAAEPESVAATIHESNPSMGAKLFTARTAALLTHDPRSLAGSRIDEDFPPGRHDPDPDLPPVERGGVPIPAPPPSADDYLSVAACVIGGSWGPYYPDPIFNSGWLFGCSVCINYDCADALARILLEWFVPGKITLGKAFLVALREASITAGLQTLGSVAGFWIAAAFFATGFQMQTANLYSNGRGVCVHFPWPLNPLPVWCSSR